MSSPLDRIEAQAHVEAKSLGEWRTVFSRDDVLALVAVARAAEPFAQQFRFPEYQHVLALREALAALGKEQA